MKPADGDAGGAEAYARAGVSQSAASTAVEALVRSLERIDTGKPSRVVPLPGHYASVLRLDERMGLALSTDTVGTKMVVAERLGRYDTIGIDCVAMSVDDVAAHRASADERFPAEQRLRAVTATRDVEDCVVTENELRAVGQ